MLPVGSVIGGRFRIDQILGAGGMGIVVAATHLELGSRVAIKFLRDEMAQSPAVVERFLREAKAVARLRTEHVCRVSDMGRLDSGAPYIVMEMLEGVDLQHTVARSPLPVTTAVEYVLQACVALAEAHAAGIIHRDLKPANLFVVRRLDGGPLVKVLDFGIAKAVAETAAHLTHQSAMGSPGYMSPEQIQSARDVDVRTDIWALGVTLYQLLSARLPFGGATITEIAIQVANDPPAPLEVDPALRAVVWKCLEKLPANRYANVAELMVALQPFGGPAARTHVGLAAQLGGTSGFAAAMTSQPNSVVVIAPSQSTQATQATQPAATTGQAVRVTPASAPSIGDANVRASTPPRRARWPWLLVALVVLGGGGAGAAWYVQAHAPSVVAAQPVDAAVAAPIAPIAIDAPAIVTVSPDAALVIASDAQAAADPWGTPVGSAGAARAGSAEVDDLGGVLDALDTPDAGPAVDAGTRAPRPPRTHTTDEEEVEAAMRVAQQMQLVMAPCQHFMASHLPDTKGYYECMCKPATPQAKAALAASPPLLAQCKAAGL